MGGLTKTLSILCKVEKCGKKRSGKRNPVVNYICIEVSHINPNQRNTTGGKVDSIYCKYDKYLEEYARGVDIFGIY